MCKKSTFLPRVNFPFKLLTDDILSLRTICASSRLGIKKKKKTLQKSWTCDFQRAHRPKTFQSITSIHSLVLNIALQKHTHTYTHAAIINPEIWLDSTVFLNGSIHVNNYCQQVRSGHTLISSSAMCSCIHLQSIFLMVQHVTVMEEPSVYFKSLFLKGLINSCIDDLH